jgi:hypothetical protein
VVADGRRVVAHVDGRGALELNAGEAVLAVVALEGRRAARVVFLLEDLIAFDR